MPFSCFTEAICDHDQVSGGISVLIVANKQDVEVSECDEQPFLWLFALLFVKFHPNMVFIWHDKFVIKSLSAFNNLFNLYNYNLCTGGADTSGPGDKLLLHAGQHRTLPRVSYLRTQWVSTSVFCYNRNLVDMVGSQNSVALFIETKHHYWLSFIYSPGMVWIWRWPLQ